MLKEILLHILLLNAAIYIVPTFVEKGADVNAVNKDGSTLLHLATKHDHKYLAKITIIKGANVNAVDRFEKTPLDYAKEHCLTNLAKVISYAGGDSFKQASYIGKISGGATALLGTAIAVALFTTGTIAIPIVIAVVAVTAAALVVGGATYMLLKLSTKIDEVEKLPVLTSGTAREC